MTDVADRSTTPRWSPDPVEAQLILTLLGTMVDPLHRTIPGSNEVVLHDLAKLPNSIVAISGGGLTGRGVGSPATDTLLSAFAREHVETNIAYSSRLPGGRELRSSTIVCRDSAGVPVAALCVNIDVTMWRAVHQLAGSMLPAQSVSADEVTTEEFASGIDELAGHLLSQAIASVHVPVELMQKRHKIAVVADLKDRGFFMLKESVETAAASLGVTRFTIYNYLNEIDGQE